MPSTGRRSEELQRKIQTRNTFLKASDFAKEHTLLERVRKSKDPVEKSKAALSDLRKRIDHRKKTLRPVNIQDYREGRQENVEDVIANNESPALAREDPFSNKKDSLADTMKRSVEKQKQSEFEGVKRSVEKQKQSEFEGDIPMKINPFRYRRDVIGEEERRAPPSQIEVRSSVEPDGDDHTEVSEITTDIRIMSTKGATYAEHRMAGKLQMRLTKPSLSGPPGHYLEKGVMNVNVNNLRHLGKAVEQAKMDLRQETTPLDVMRRRHGLPYEDTDYIGSTDADEEGDSWDEVIRVSDHERKIMANPGDRKNVGFQDPLATKMEREKQMITKKAHAGKLQHLVKEAYSHEGDVFIDATDIREEDLDGVAPGPKEEVLDLTEQVGNNQNSLIEVEDTILNQLLTDEEEQLPLGGGEDRLAESETVIKPREDTAELCPTERFESDEGHVQDSAPEITDGENEIVDGNDVGADDLSLDDLEQKPPHTTSSFASDMYESSLGLFKSFCSQVDAQIKAIQERGLISKGDMDRMLGVLEQDVDETQTRLPEDGNDMVLMFGDELEATACGTGLGAVGGNDENENENEKEKDQGQEQEQEQEQEQKQVQEQGQESKDKTNPDPVEKMLESLKNTYESSVAKCGVGSSLIKENTKAIEKIVANLKKVHGSNSSHDDKQSGLDEEESSQPQFEYEPEPPEDEIDEEQVKEQSTQGVNDTMKIQFI
eukprot:jgi/Psemu1/63767/estExt_Genemark1.C_350125